MNKIIQSYIFLFLWIMFLVGIGSLCGLLTKDQMFSWYLNLNRSPLTPPSYVFGIVWTILYVLIASAGWMIWNADNVNGLLTIKIAYIVQLLLNWSWTPLFFTFHFIGGAFIVLISLVSVVGFLIVKTYTQLPFVSVLLIPYAAWLVCATYLQFYIWLYN